MRVILKLAIVAIFCCVAFFMVRLAISTISDDIDKKANVVVDKQKGVALKPSASTSDLTIEHNAERNGLFGMFIHSKQKYRNLKGIACYTILYFFDDKGKPLKGNRFKDSNGNFCFIAPPLIPEADNIINEQRSFIPYDEFNIPEGETVFYNCCLSVYIENDKNQRVELASSPISRFHLAR